MESFFIGYRKTALEKGEVLTKIVVPLTRPLEFVMAFKQSKRKDDDIAIVNAGMRVWLGEDLIVKEASLCYGGLAPMTVQ
jgi:xanthine dehydrogenase/oxidase